MESFLLNLLNGVGQIDFQLVWKLVGVAFLIFWIVVLDWVWLDSGERTTSKTARVIYLLLVLFLNVFGWIIYLILRPSQTIEQIYWSDLERRYLKYETSELGDCPRCGTQLYPGFVYCSKCGLELKTQCPSCNVYVEKSNEYCPFCGVKITQSIITEEAVPTKEMMEQQILASKEEAAKIVESEQTRYSSKKRGITVRIGNAIIGFYKGLIKKIQTKSDTQKQIVKISAASQKKHKRHKKNRKH